MLLAVFLASGSSEGEIEGVPTIVTDILISLQNLLFQKMQEVISSLALSAVENFGPNMETFLKIFGYDPSKYAIQSWASATDAGIGNLFAIFAVIGYLLAIVILIVSLLKCAAANVIETHDKPMVLLIRFLMAFLMITYSNSLIKMILNISQKIFDKIFAATSANISTPFTLSMDTSEAVDTLTKLGSLNISVLGLLGTIFAIIITVEFLKMVIELITKYLIVGVLYITFPAVASTFVSRDTENIFRSYFRMLFSSIFVLLLNVWAVDMYMTLISSIGNTEMSALSQCLTVIAFEKFAQKLDDYLNSLGLNNATSGGMLMDQIMMAAGTVLAAPGRVAAAGQGAIDLANLVPKTRMNLALSRGDYASAAEAANGVLTPSEKMAAMSKVRDSVATANLSAEQISKLGIDNSILNSDGRGFTGATVAHAVKAASNDSIENAIKKHTGGNVKLDDQAHWDKKDHAWHMNAHTDDGDVGLKIRSKSSMEAGDKGFATFKDSTGKEWAVMHDKPDLENQHNQDAIKKAVDKDGNIRDAWQAERLTGLHTNHGVKVNSDRSFSSLDADGNTTGERFVPDGKGGFFNAYDDDYVAKNMDADGGLGVHLGKMKQDAEGGFTASMTLDGLYGEDDENKATFDVRFGSADTQRADETEFSTFVDPATGEKVSVFMSDEAAGNLMQQSAGKDIHNQAIAGAMMGLSEEDMQAMTEPRGTSDLMTDTYHVSDNSTTISRMDSAGHAVVSSKYSKRGEYLYSYASGEGDINDQIFTDASAFNAEFETQLDDTQRAHSVERSTGRNGYDDIVVESESGERRTYVNANNLSPNAKVRSTDSVLRDKNDNVFVERKPRR